MKTEFHVHTRISNDSILPYWLLLLVLKMHKISTVAITDHNEVKGALKYKKKFKKYGIEVIVGEEIFTNKGEIIGLGLKRKIEPGLSPSDTIKKIKDQHGLVYVPHPYDEKRYKTVLVEEEIKKNRKNIDFIEVHNGRNASTEFDKKQNEIAEKYKITKIVGSDAHTFFELGRNYIETNEKLTIENLKKNYNKVIFKEKKCIIFAHHYTKMARIISYLCKGDFYGIIRVIKRKITRRK